MLRRHLYVGRLVWNRRHFIKTPGTNKRVSRERPPSEWLTIEKPELRIIDESLWARVQQRIALVAETYNYQNRPGLAPRSLTSHNLLTGFMKCGICGANLTIVSGLGKQNHPRYGCPQNYNRGACSNNLKERADFLEERLFSDLQSAVLQPKAIAFAVQEFERQLASSLAGLNTSIGRLRQRSEEIKAEIEAAVSNLIACKNNPTLVGVINRRQKELDEIRQQLLNTEPDLISTETARIRQFVTGQLGDIRQLLKVDVQRAKAQLAKHVGEIRMLPQLEGKRSYYIAEGAWNLLGGYGTESRNRFPTQFRMVAGEGFEPPTFGL